MHPITAFRCRRHRVRWRPPGGSISPGWLDHFIFNEYYPTEKEFLFALADAVHEEYRAVVAAGFVLQIDDPGLPDWWDMLKPEPTVESYRRFARLRVRTGDIGNGTYLRHG